MRLSDISFVQVAVNHAHPDTCRVLSFVLFGEHLRLNRRRILDFQGFEWDIGLDEFTERVQLIVQQLSAVQLSSVCGLLSIDPTGEAEQLAVRLLTRLCDLQSLTVQAPADEDVDDFMPVSDTSAAERGKVQHSSKQTNSLVTFRDLEGVVSSYNGSDVVTVDAWIEQFEEVSTVLGLSDIQKLIFGKKTVNW